MGNGASVSGKSVSSNAEVSRVSSIDKGESSNNLPFSSPDKKTSVSQSALKYSKTIIEEPNEGMSPKSSDGNNIFNEPAGEKVLSDNKMKKLVR